MTARLTGPIAFLALAALPAALAAAEGTRSCAVDAVEGETARYWESGVWSGVAEGLAIPVEAKIATGPEDRVRIVCDDGVVVTVGAATEVNLEQLAGPAGRDRNVFVQLLEGIVGVLAPARSWGRFEVRTPVAIASVRSTEWLVENMAGEAAVFVRDGRVAVDVRDGGRVTLAAGEGITVAADGAPGEVKTWGAARIERSTAALGFDWR
jgi:hypothetical protein